VTLRSILLAGGLCVLATHARAACTITVTPTSGGTVTVTGATTSGGCAPDSTPTMGGAEVSATNHLPVAAGYASTRFTGLVPATLVNANWYTNTTAGCTGTETLTLLGGTFTTAATMRVNGVDGNGRVVGLVLLQGGSYSVEPSNPISVTFNTPSTCTGALTVQPTGWTGGIATIGTTPTHGWKIATPGGSDLWVTDDGTTPSVAGNTSLRVPYSGGQYATETGELPLGFQLHITSPTAFAPYIASVW
jgi:hypothetical protein